ncbi:alpha/beta hydrolase [Leifsonia sp. fls2-241-R2A-40a]|uniref:alpha/beta fold hydrolase n=1 Tax=Leifsonia sp. fls2-241-R2A-40a TaxID=3040290 RepID=UPI00254E539B|nr:alpha/beta hydrolase [Leifsonia sp. fls2-241-R2A-40a]
MTAHGLRTADGRAVRYFDTGGDPGAPVLIWHHGTPQTGAVIAPVAAAAAARGLRVLSVTRPGYPGSDALPGRSIADAAADILAVADARGIDRFVTVGASGGGPHALALGALAPERVSAIVTLAGLAPNDGSPDWFSGMASPHALRAAIAGREARLAYAETAEFDPESFTARDFEVLDGDWGALGADAGAGAAEGPTGEVDDDLAYVSPWGFDLPAVRPPVLLVQGGADRVVPAGHAAALLERLPNAELWIRPREGHVSVLTVLGVTLDWALAQS